MGEVICPDCGTPLERNDENTVGFCPSCQASWQICPRCQKTSDPQNLPNPTEHCPSCGKSTMKIECPKCHKEIWADSKVCPKCKTKFTVAPCPGCGNKVLVDPSLDICPVCETFHEQRCGHCQAPYATRGIGERCKGCGRYL